MSTKKGAFSKNDAMPAKRQPFASRGQSAREDFRGAFSKEVPAAPVEKHGNRAYARGQEWSGPYTTSKYDKGSRYDLPHDAAGNPKR